MPRRTPRSTPTTDESTPVVARGATPSARRSRPTPVPTPAAAGAPTATASETETPQAEPETAAPGAIAPGEKVVERSRAGGLWIGAIALAVLVILLVIFIAQNSQRVTIHFVGLHGHFSLAIALLVALVGGVLVVAIPGSVRILQLRRTVKKRTVQM
jgi:uncharacterized integral membrane protein